MPHKVTIMFKIYFTRTFLEKYNYETLTYVLMDNFFLVLANIKFTSV